MKPAVLVIDMQSGLFEEEKPPDYDTIIDNVNTVTSHARQNNWPVIFIQHEEKRGLLKEGSSGWALVPELHTESVDQRVRKTTPNAFVQTDLNEKLKQYAIENLIVCGYATEFCVDSTVRGGAALGYSIHIVSDAHTTHDKHHASAEFIRNHHNVTLASIKSFGVSIEAVQTEKILDLGSPAD